MEQVNININTVFERDSVVKFLDQFDQIIFDSKIDVKSWVEKNAPIEFSVESVDPEELFTKSKALRKDMMSLSTIGISVSMELDDSFIDKMSSWIFENTGKKVLLDIRNDKDLLGGAIVESGGYIFEHSFRSYFEKNNYGF